MSLLKCDFRVVGPIQTNCYFLYREDTKECLIIDPGYEADKIEAYVQKKQLHVAGILLTHGHFDHITAADEVRKKFQTKIYASGKEKELMADPRMNVSVMMGESVSLKADVWLEDGQELEMLGETMRCILTPGHTGGGMCFYFPKACMLFSGDTLFQESVGRTDFPTGSSRELIRSVREKLLVLPEAVRVYPGHGLMTTIRDEQMFNPYAVQ
ncbi:MULTISPECIES: MBL fold metallo-hydrolase [Jutongia]|jgi:hydroxyacylglutathione hydrolase|uniref:MBL fold metallo-hydrolase n=1 Tax=Jutongia huaianensis TaxID=2763668 RepID=A0ABR7N1I4_9FIRM|nr:MBL fold metallo-hydrolase [Jutongia huaianensis]MBC8562497.1 MBL fold metallo-hydrolase [Jutongia huaianensis]MBS4815710.1 MBL fold metallo-hydrolase [Clostridium sp.]